MTLPIKAIAAGWGFALAVDASGRMWAWGSNYDGALGNPSVPVRVNGIAYLPVPVAVPSGMVLPITSVSAGHTSAYALDSAGQVWAWGNNNVGQLGNGTTTSSNVPVKVLLPATITQIAASDGQQNIEVPVPTALDSTGHAWAWGDYNPSGPGLSMVPVQVPTFPGMALPLKQVLPGPQEVDAAGHLWASDSTGNCLPDQVQVPFQGSIVAAVTGDIGFTDGGVNCFSIDLLLDTSGQVWELLPAIDGLAIAIENFPAQASLPIQSISTAGLVTSDGPAGGLVIDSAGRLWNWGFNLEYQLGDGTQLPTLVPEQPGHPRVGTMTGAGPTLVELLGGAPIDELQTGSNCGCFPVDTATGNFWHSFSDLSVPGRGIPLGLQRTYNSLAAGQNGRFGFGWTDSYDASITFDGSGNPTVHEENGGSIPFTLSGGAYAAPTRVLASLVKNGDGTYTLTRRDKSQLVFSSGGQLQAEADRNGYRTTMAYTGGQLTSVTDPAGRSFTFAYTGNVITQVTDVAGNRSVTYGYDANGDLRSVTDVGGFTSTYTYYPGHLLHTMTDPRGGVVTNVYDGSGRVTSQTDPLQNQTTFDYSVPNQTRITRPDGSVTLEVYQNNVLVERTEALGTPQEATTSYSYDPNTLGITSMVDSRLEAWSRTYDASGNVLTATDPLGNTTTYTYNSFNEVLTAKDPLGVTTTNTYDAQGNLKTTSRPLVGTSQVAGTLNNYDPARPGDLLTATDADGKTASFTYDRYGNRKSITDPMGNRTTMDYDAIGRMNSSVSPKGNVPGADPLAYTTLYGHNAFGQVTSVTDPLVRQTVTDYDQDGNAKVVTDANGHRTTTDYDLGNRPTQVTRDDGTTQVTHYDWAGHVTEQFDGLGQRTAYTYDPRGRRLTMTDPLGRVTTYGYDATGNPTTLIDPQGRITTNGYNADGQLTSVTYSDGLTPNVSYNYDADGQRTGMTDGTGSTTYTYDSLQRLTQVTSGFTTAGYGYDLKGQLTSITYPNGVGTVTRTYYDNGLLHTVTDWLNNQTTYTYDPNSNPATEQYPNGVTATFTFDAANQERGISDAHGTAAPFLNYGYDRDGVGQLKADNALGYLYDDVNRIHTAGPAGSITTYGFDNADQLTTVTRPDGTVLTNKYDAGGQLQTATVTSGASQVSQVSFSYDPSGNRITSSDQAGNSVSYGYDQAGNLTNYSGTTYAYDGDHLRTSKYGFEIFAYDLAEGLPTIIQDGSTSYVTGLGGLPLEQVNADGSVLYYHQDHLGSTRALTDSTGAVAATYDYDPYGALTGSTGFLANPNPFLYAGQYQDPESGLYYLRARYYDPQTAQFISRDPAMEMTRTPYAYAGGSPLNRVDPSGVDDFFWTGFVQAGIAIGQSLSGSNREAYRDALACAGEWVGTTSAELNSSDAGQRLQGIYDSLMFLGLLVPGEGEAEGAIVATEGTAVVAENELGGMAAVDPRKFSNYAFVTPKAPVFTRAGYSAADSLDLSAEYAQQAADKYASGNYTLGKLDQYGQRINIEINLPGRGGMPGRTINSGWMIQSDGTITLNTPLG